MRRRETVRRFLLALAAVLVVAGAGRTQAPEHGPAQPVALVAAIEGPIGPATLRHVDNAIEVASMRGAGVLVLRLNTPGGLASSMREIVARILASPVPIAGFVAPSGAHAASAGTYILYATHVAAMAPGTNLGAATPVRIGGGLPGQPGSPPKGEGTGEGAKDGAGKDGDGNDGAESPAGGDAMGAKATNDAVAFIRSLAEMRGRDAEWAEAAVREAASLSARPARERGVVEIVADDIDGLLAALDGRTVSVHGGERTIASAGARVEHVEPSFLTRALGVLSNPNIAFVLMLIGIYGLVFEFANPGSVGPGVAGVVCLVLGLYALGQLPIDYAGLALVLAGMAFMVAEAVTPTFGVLGAGGLVAFVLGAAMLIDTDVPAYQLSWWVIGGAAAASGGMLVLLLGYVWRVYRRPSGAGPADMRGEIGEILDWSGGEGYVLARGERWAARSPATLRKGQTVRINALDGLTLEVEPAGDADDSGTKGE